MATSDEIAEVRKNTDELSTDNYTDDQISDLIDKHGVNGASAEIWRDKAAKTAGLVDTKDGSSSRSMSQAHQNALRMAGWYESRPDDVGTPTEGRTRIHRIQR